MYNLIRFLQKHHFFLLFLLLETLSVVMLSRSHTYHKAVIGHQTNHVMGKVYQLQATIQSYFGLRKSNLGLQEQNAALLAELQFYKQQMPAAYSTDSMFVHGFMPANVIKNTTHLRNNYFIIDKGAKDGIQKDMGVAGVDGVAGIVIGVSENYATAMSLLHKYATLSVRFKNNDQIANLHWRGGDYHLADVVDIPTHIELQQGDTIQTSGHSFVFPEGMMVGTVEEVLQSGQNNMNAARIRFSVDFNKLRYVYVVSNAHKQELDELSEIRTNE